MPIPSRIGIGKASLIVVVPTLKAFQDHTWHGIQCLENVYGN